MTTVSSLQWLRSMVGDGAYLPISHVGSTTLATTEGRIPVSDVLIVPTKKESLLSVSKFPPWS